MPDYNDPFEQVGEPPVFDVAAIKSARQPRPDDERFCSSCKAGIESSEHLTSPCGEGDQ